MAELPAVVTPSGNLHISNQGAYTLSILFADTNGDPIDVSGTTMTFRTSGGFSKQLTPGASVDLMTLELDAGDLSTALGRFEHFVIRDEAGGAKKVYYEGRVSTRSW